MRKEPPVKSAFFTIEGNQITISESLKLDNTAVFLKDIEFFFRANPNTELSVNLTFLKQIDSAGAVAIHSLMKRANKYNITLNIKDPQPTIKNKLNLFKPVEKKTTTGSYTKTFLYKLGDKAIHFLTEYVVAFTYLVSDILFWSVRDVFYTKQRRKGEFFNQAVSIGVNALPIVASMSFIIGLVLALQSASQLRNFGANIYIVDLTVIAMMAEMGPLITAILVAGRSGSAIAAEIATMKVTSELDALRTMGINPLRFVVVPKIYGSFVTMPFLTILASISGIMGGALAAYLYLDITPEIFFNRMEESLYQKDIITSLIKSFVFALIIVMTGTFFGLKVQEGAEGVGNSTTSSVVTAITLVIIADSILGLIFY